MRVCLVSRELAPFFGGGIGTYTSLMARAWAEAGHEVHVLTDAHPGLEEIGPRLRPGVRFHAAPTTEGVAAADGWPCWAMRPAMAVHECLGRLHGCHRFEYIEFPDWCAEGYFALRARRTLGRYADAALGVRLHTPDSLARELNGDTWLDLDRAYIDEMETSAMREADLLLSPTESLLAIARERWGVVGSRIDRVIRLPFDDSCLGELGLTEAGPGPTPDGEAGSGSASDRDGPTTVLYYGRLERRKGVELLVEAGVRLLGDGVDVRFVLIGGDTLTGPFGSPMAEHLRRLIGPTWAQRFTFERARPRGDLGRAIRGATVCCFPSIWENFPFTCVESMMMGACVVASDAGGMGEMIEDGSSGLLFKSGCAESLERALRRAIQDRDLRRRIRAGAPERIRSQCDPGRIVGEMVETIEQVRALAASSGWDGHPARQVKHGAAPSVSIVIPHYNLGRYLPDAVASVMSQTLGDYELIVVDDGSTDAASVEALDRIVGTHRRIVLIRQPNRGLGSARNAGLARARGRYFLPLDADDMLDPTFLATSVGVMRADPALACVSTLVRYFMDDPANATGAWAPLGLVRHMLPVVNCGGTPASLFRTEVVRAAGGYDTARTGYEDWDLYCTLAERGERSSVIPEFLFWYRHRDDSMMRVDCLPRHHALRAYLMGRHPNLSDHPGATARLLVAEARRLGDELNWHRTQLDEARQALQRHRHEMGPDAGEPDAVAAGDERARVIAQRMIEANIRYRVADRINDTLKAIGLHGAIKTVARRAMRRP